MPDPTLQQENERLRRAVAELSVLNEVAREIGAMREPERVMNTLVRRATEAVAAEQGLITLVDPEREDLQHTLVRGTAPAHAADRFHVPMPLLGWMHRHRQPLLVPGPHMPPAEVEWHPAVESALLVPLLVKGALTGILAVFNKRGRAGFDADDQRLLSILAAQSAQVLENARLWHEQQELQRLRSELDVAATIQSRLLPTHLPAWPGYDFAAESRPAEVVGGDFFDVIPLDERRVALCLGDVSGKGLPAALVMANAQALLRSLLRWGTPVHEALRRANRMLHESTDARTFVTLFAAVLDGEAHLLTYANAGHTRPLIARAGAAVRSLDEGALALGLRPDAAYTSLSCPLEPGDVLLLYSDGATEAMDARHDLFGTERLADALARSRHLPAPALQQHVLAAIEQHAGGAPPSDDLTLLVVQRR